MIYKVVEGSQSCHCCFSYTVVDTRKPVMIGGEHYDNQYESVCETFEENEANLICNALNATEQSAQRTLDYCPCHLPQVHGHLEKNCPHYYLRG